MLWFPSSHSIPREPSLPSQVSDGGPLESFASTSATLPSRSHTTPPHWTRLFTPPQPSPLHWSTTSSSIPATTESAGSAASLGFTSRERAQSATALGMEKKPKEAEETMASHPPPPASASFPLTIPIEHTGTVATTTALPPYTSPAMADYERREWELLMEGILEEQVRCESTVLAWMARAEALEREVRELRAAAAAKENPPPPPPRIETLPPPSLPSAEEAHEALWWMEAAVEEQIKILRQEKKKAMAERDASQLAHTRLLDALQQFGQWWWDEAVEAGMAGPVIPTGGGGGVPARLAAASSSSSVAAAARPPLEPLARRYGIRTPSTPSGAAVKSTTTTSPFRARHVNTSGWGSGKGREKGGILPVSTSMTASSKKRQTKKVPSHLLPKEEEKAEVEEAERVDVWDRLYHHLFSARRPARQAISSSPSPSSSSLVWSSPPRHLTSSTFSLSAAQWQHGSTTTPPRDAPNKKHRHAFETLSRKAPPPQEEKEDKDEEDVAYGTHLLLLLQRACRCGFEAHRHLLSTAMASRA